MLLTKKLLCVSTLVLLLGSSSWNICHAEGPTIDQLADSKDQIKVVDSQTVKIGNVSINRLLGEISCEGWINQDSGLVEYLAVTPYGKTHESVLVLDIRPIHLQLALILIGLDYEQNLKFQGDTTLPIGDLVTIDIEWEHKGVIKSYNAHDLLLIYGPDEKIEMTNWVFTGSFISEDDYAADFEGSIIATYTDPVAILNNPYPGRINDSYYGVNDKIMPPPKTKIRMVIKKI